MAHFGGYLESVGVGELVELGVLHSLDRQDKETCVGLACSAGNAPL